MAAGESPPVGDVFIDLQQVRWESGSSGAVSSPGPVLLLAESGTGVLAACCSRRHSLRLPRTGLHEGCPEAAHEIVSSPCRQQTVAQKRPEVAL